MKELFYSKSEGILFWVAGYTRDGNTNNVSQMVQSLQENAQKFANKANIKLEKVQTIYNTCPPRYQYMRIFYAHCEPIEDAYILGEDWTMIEWLTT